MLVTDIAIFFQGFADDASQFRGDFRIQSKRRYRGLLQDCVEDHRRGIAGERRAAGDHFIKHSAERKKVSARVEFLATGLFRRHVCHGSDSLAGAGEVLLAD